MFDSETALTMTTKRVKLASRDWRVDDVKRHVHDVRDQKHVALSAAAAAVLAERLLKSKLYQQMLQVVNRVRVRGVPHSRAFLQVRVVSEQTSTHIAPMQRPQHSPAKPVCKQLKK